MRLDKPIIRFIGDLIAYGLMRVIEVAVHCLPRKSLRFAGNALGTLAYYAVPIRKKLVLSNLKRAFPDKSGSWRRQTTLKIYRHYAWSFLEFFKITDLNAANLNDLVDFTGLEHVGKAVACGRGVVYVTGHIGVWEYLSIAHRLKGYGVACLATRQHNILTDALLNKYRMHGGVKIIYKGEGVRPVLGYLKKGWAIAFLTDQNAGTEGAPVNFFGKAATAHIGPVRFAIHAQAPMVFTYMIRKPDGRLAAYFEEPVIPKPGDDPKVEGVEYLQYFTDRIEAAVREYPEQWFWFHNRWRSPNSNKQAGSVSNEKRQDQ